MATSAVLTSGGQKETKLSISVQLSVQLYAASPAGQHFSPVSLTLDIVIHTTHTSCHETKLQTTFAYGIYTTVKIRKKCHYDLNIYYRYVMGIIFMKVRTFTFFGPAKTKRSPFDRNHEILHIQYRHNLTTSSWTQQVTSSVSRMIISWLLQKVYSVLVDPLSSKNWKGKFWIDRSSRGS